MAKSSKKLKIGHVQDTPVSTSMISNECMICHMKVHIVSYNLDQKKISKSKIHILPVSEQTDLKTAMWWTHYLSSKIHHWGYATWFVGSAAPAKIFNFFGSTDSGLSLLTKQWAAVKIRFSSRIEPEQWSFVLPSFCSRTMAMLQGCWN